MQTMPETNGARRKLAGELAALAVFLLLAGALRFARLETLGYANHYYSAAVASMLQSAHNFFFVAAEPGASVSVDKPPLGLWLQAASAAVFGLNGFAVLLPQILAGMASVVLLYALVRRSFGGAAGLLAALALAVTPITVAADRNNTMDSTLILALLLAAWAFLAAAESGRLRHLLIGAALVGVGFNIKMLQAYLPLPAFFGLYLLAGAGRFWRRLAHLALAGAVLLVVSFSWSAAVDLTPASQRPYVGSSSDNSVASLIFGYNGVNRLLGMFGRGRPAAPLAQPGSGPLPPAGQDGGLRPRRGDGGGFQIPFGQPGGALVPGAPGQRIAGGGPGFNIGQAGALRLFLPPLSKETSWLLPFGLAALLLLLGGLGGGCASRRPGWRHSPEMWAVLVWGGWLAAGAVFFSVAGFFHEYYLSMLAPPLAALVGIGAVVLWRLYQARPRLAAALLLAAAGLTLLFQAVTAAAFTRQLWWLALAGGTYAIGLLLLIGASGEKTKTMAAAGFASLAAAMLAAPLAWSALTVLYPVQNQSLPAAYRGEIAGMPASGGAGARFLGGIPGQAGVQVNQELLDFLEENTQGMEYLMAVPSSMQGADYVLATGRPVLYIGGFNGQDAVISSSGLQEMVSQGRLRYIYWGRALGSNQQSAISAWLESACQPVAGFDTGMVNQGAPDGTGGAVAQGPGQIQAARLYDCAR